MDKTALGSTSFIQMENATSNTTCSKLMENATFSAISSKQMENATPSSTSSNQMENATLSCTSPKQMENATLSSTSSEKMENGTLSSTSSKQMENGTLNSTSSEKMENGALETKDKPHCLILTYPLQGHVNPLLQFSKRLQFKGAQITFVTTKSFLNLIKDATGGFSCATVSDGFDEGGREKAPSIETYLQKFQEEGSRTLEELIEKLRSSGSPVDCIIYDAFIPWALDVAKKHAVAGAAFFTQSCAVGSIYYHVYNGAVKIDPDAAVAVEKEYEIPGLPVLKYLELPSFVSRPEAYPAVAEMLINQFVNIEKADWVLVNTYYKLEQEVIEWMSKICAVKAIGPTIPSLYLDKRLEEDTDYGLAIFTPMGDACKTWLSQREPKSVVYVSFGSLAQLGPEAMAEIAWGLKMSNKHFLWVVRESEQPNLPENFVEQTLEMGLIVSWCPQLEVLANEAIACFVTHCGWNSTLEALSLGVPMVAVPQWTDQTTNAKYVSDVWKMGITAAGGGGVVGREVIRKCIEEVMDGERGEEIRAIATTWMELARAAADHGGSSDKDIEEFVSKLSASSSPPLSLSPEKMS